MYENIGKYVSEIYRHNMIVINKEFADLNIGAGQYIFLINLYRNEGIRQEEISENVKIDKGTTARAIKKLEEEGYVYRKVDEKDKRANRIFLTKKAINIKEEFFSRMEKIEKRLHSEITKEEELLVKEILYKISKSIGGK